MLLFESLSNSSNFEPKKIKEASKKTLEGYKDKSLKEISIILKEKSDTNPVSYTHLTLPTTPYV